MVFWALKLLAQRLDALRAQSLTNALASDQNTDCLQIRVEFTIGRVKGMAARFAEHGFLTALFTLRHDEFLVQKLRTQSVMLPQAGTGGKMGYLRFAYSHIMFYSQNKGCRLRIMASEKSENYEFALLKFGRRIRALRISQKLSQEDLSLITGLDRTYISGVERGIRNISLKNIFHLSNALGVSIAALFEDNRE